MSAKPHDGFFEDATCTGMDVPTGQWTSEDIFFWTGTRHYQPWKDVAAFFHETKPRD